MVGDGSYLMMTSEIVTAVAGGRQAHRRPGRQPRLRAPSAACRESVGVERFGTAYRYRDRDRQLDGDALPVDLAANAREPRGARAARRPTRDELADALADARAADRTTVIVIETDPRSPAPAPTSWWDVPVAEVSTRASTRAARELYESGRAVSALPGPTSPDRPDSA